MMFHAHITTENQADPVTIEGDSEQTLPVMLRIGDPEPGKSRYVELTTPQALAIARALHAAARLTAVKS